jgi:hypothetical protein
MLENPDYKPKLHMAQSHLRIIVKEILWVQHQKCITSNFSLSLLPSKILKEDQMP